MNYINFNTGGPLNTINEKYYINSIKNFGFGMMDFIDKYKPETPQEVVELIEKHSHTSIPKLGQQLFEAQKQEGLTFTLEDCINFEYTLFCVNSLRGITMEKEAVKYFNDETIFKAKRTTTAIDNEFSIDIVLGKDNKMICAIQVKPDSYKNCSDKIKNINKYKNKLFKEKHKVPVYYLYYNKYGWTSMNEIISLLEAF